MQAIYKLPKLLLATVLIGGGIAYILISDPPHHFCDSQTAHFKKIQKGGAALKRERTLCKEENRPGACYEYFAHLRRFLRSFRILSQECLPLIQPEPGVRKTLAGGLVLMTALAWREGILSSGLSKYNWLSEPDLHLFCELKTKYVLFYGQVEYKRLESTILQLLPVKKQVPPNFLIRKTILIEPCSRYR